MGNCFSLRGKPLKKTQDFQVVQVGEELFRVNCKRSGKMYVGEISNIMQ